MNTIQIEIIGLLAAGFTTFAFVPQAFKISIAPTVGMMIMFPSYLLHTVYPFVGKEERRCIAFTGVYRIIDDKGTFIAGDLSGVQNPTFYTKEKGKS